MAVVPELSHAAVRRSARENESARRCEKAGEGQARSHRDMEERAKPEEDEMGTREATRKRGKGGEREKGRERAEYGRGRTRKDEGRSEAEAGLTLGSTGGQMFLISLSFRSSCNFQTGSLPLTQGQTT